MGGKMTEMKLWKKMGRKEQITMSITGKSHYQRTYAAKSRLKSSKSRLKRARRKRRQRLAGNRKMRLTRSAKRKRNCARPAGVSEASADLTGMTKMTAGADVNKKGGIMI